jgi:hypothetical protein
MEAESAFYGRALARIYRYLWLVTAAGAVAAGIASGFRVAVSFLLGALGGVISFWTLHQFVEALDPGAKSPHKRLAVFAVLRYLGLTVAGYVIVKFFGMNAIAVIGGLFVPVAAVTIEILYELIHGTGT